MSDSDEPIRLNALDRREISRRRALQLLAGGMAATQAACLRAPGEEVEGYVDARVGHVAGRAEYYATSMLIGGFATGLVAETHAGRPTKLDGNPRHPASLGASSAQHQAALYELYDPQRTKAVTRGDMPSSWEALEHALAAHRSRPLWLILPEDSSPLHQSLLERLETQRPGTRVVRLGQSTPRNTYQGARLVFGRALETQYAFARADLVAALDSDFLATGSMATRWAMDFASRRRPDSPGGMNRLFVVEPMLTSTGSLADHRLAVPAADVLPIVITLAEQLRAAGKPLPELSSAAREASEANVRARGAQAWVQRLGKQLIAHAGRSLLLVGERQPAACHALALHINVALGNLGQTISFTEPALLDPLASSTLTELAAAMGADDVGSVVAIDANPVYHAPPGLKLAELWQRVPLSVHASTYRNETSEVCTFHAPLSHLLESWGDGRAGDGTLSFVQPLIRPLYDTRTPAELLANLAGEPRTRSRDLLQRLWRERWGAASFAPRWSNALAQGLVENSAWPLLNVTAETGGALQDALARWQPPPGQRMELDLALSPALYDGSFSHNAWLQELPHPITKLTWTNAALIAPDTARKLELSSGQLAKLRAGDRELSVPVLVVPGHAESCVTLELGYGRRCPHAPIADGLGVDGYGLVASAGQPWVLDVELTPTERRVQLPITQGDQRPHDRGQVGTTTLAAYQAPGAADTHDAHGPQPTLHDGPTPTAPVQWAMSIDTTLCTGCGSCVIACQAENNVPVVGAEGVRRGRVMHWLRIDTYHLHGDDGAWRESVHQPMLCQHCEHAPCEYVCPVFATQHSPDGLNEMVYNRCVGTRFCSNNCPYKVRRFNWFNYTGESGTLALQRNPDVTTRERGVMEKCTYCVQRIRRADVQARVEKRAIAPGEVVTACQQACPTRAIQFGALEHTNTPMVTWRSDPRCYAVLHDLGTRPRTLYLAKLTNPVPGEPS